MQKTTQKELDDQIVVILNQKIATLQSKYEIILDYVFAKAQAFDKEIIDLKSIADKTRADILEAKKEIQAIITAPTYNVSMVVETSTV